jgi:hypothetical protein
MFIDLSGWAYMGIFIEPENDKVTVIKWKHAEFGGVE